MPRVIKLRRPYRLLAGILMTALIAGFTGAVGVRTVHAASGWVNQNAIGPDPVVSVYDSTHHVVLAMDNSQTWTWNTTTRTWTAMHAAHSPAAGGVLFAMAFDSARGKAVVVASPYPNAQANPTNFVTTWEWDGTDWTQLAPAHNPPARSGFSQAFTYDSKRGVSVLFSGQFNGWDGPGDTWEWNGTDWTDRTGSTGPIKRYNQCLAFDSTRNVTVLFGGFENHGSGGGGLTDTWEYDGKTWTSLGWAGLGGFANACTMVYDPVIGRVIDLTPINAPLNTVALEPYYWDGTTWVDTKLPGPGTDGFTAAYDVANDTVVVDLFPLSVGSNETWLLNPPPPPPAPGNGPQPVVTAISPDHGQSGVVTTVTVTGSGFTGATAMSFHAGQPVMNLCGQQPVGVPDCFTVNSDTQITAFSPPLDISSADVYVVTPNGISVNSPADVYTYEGWDSSTPAEGIVIDVARSPAQPTTFTLRLLESGMATIGHSPLPTWMTCADTRNPPTTAGITAQVDCSVSPTSNETDTISFFDAKDASRVPTRHVTIRVIYQPDPNGYPFKNFGQPLPTYASMQADYPASAWEMTWPIIGTPTKTGLYFYALFEQFMAGGLCYGFAATSAYFYNDYSSSPLYTFKAFKGGPGTALPFAFDGHSASIQDLLERYHSRQLAQLGAHDGIVSYKQALKVGNGGVFNQLVGQVAKQPEIVAIVPNSSVKGLRWAQLFNIGHVVVAYDTTTDAGGQSLIKVYDPNSPGDSAAVLTVDKQGGLTLSGTGYTSYGGGGAIQGGGDFGKPSEWQAVPLPDFTWQDGSTESIAPLIQIDNKHWAPPAGLVFLLGAAANTVPDQPILIASGTGSPVRFDQVAPGTSYSATLSTSAANAMVGRFSAGHVAVATQTDAGAPGSSHNLSIDGAASSLHLSAASGAQQYTLHLAADYLPNYGRELTLTGVNLPPNTAIDVSTDPASSSYTLSSTGADQVLPAVIDQSGQGAGTTTVQALIPGAGGHATLSVSDWTDVAHSLIYETIVRNGQATVRILQDNPVQRQSLTDSLFQQLGAAVATIPDRDLRQALDAAVQVALVLFHRGDHKTAAALLLGLERATTLLAAKHAITAATAASIVSLSQQIRGLL